MNTTNIIALQNIDHAPGLHPTMAYKELPVATTIEYRPIPVVIINAVRIMLKGQISRIEMIRFVRLNSQFDSLLEAKRVVDAIEAYVNKQAANEPQNEISYGH